MESVLAWACCRYMRLFLMLKQRMQGERIPRKPGMTQEAFALPRSASDRDREVGGAAGRRGDPCDVSLAEVHVILICG